VCVGVCVGVCVCVCVGVSVGVVQVAILYISSVCMQLDWSPDLPLVDPVG